MRIFGDKFALADHIEGLSELVVVEVYDGNLTLSYNLSGRAKINWLTVEALADGGSPGAEVKGYGEGAWLPTSDEAYHEVELKEQGAPVGLVVVELPAPHRVVVHQAPLMI